MPKDHWRSPHNAKGIFLQRVMWMMSSDYRTSPHRGYLLVPFLSIPYWLSESNKTTIVRLPGFPNTTAFRPETSDKAQSCSVETPSVVSMKGKKPTTGYFQNYKRPYKRIHKQFATRTIHFIDFGHWPTKLYKFLEATEYNSRE
jgi:hypothetical protein